MPCRTSLAAFAALATIASAHAGDAPPPWAYPVEPPGTVQPADDGTPHRVPGSDARYTAAQIADGFVAPDWHPADHPPMPDIVAHGRRPKVFACGSCHRPDGSGAPDTASLAGLPADYLVQQMMNFRIGVRVTSVPERGVVGEMVALAQHMSEAEIEAAANYFAALKSRANLQVIEAATVPRTIVSGGILARTEGTEPIGGRIIETPEDLQRYRDADPRVRFIVYVPPGSIAAGEALAHGAGGKIPPCGSCHGSRLQGHENIPGIAGRSPSYLMRQLYDFKHGRREGPGSAAMKIVLEELSIEEMTALAAYAASLPP